MTSEEFNALFDNARHSVFRLECLQTYAVSADDASLAAFRTGAPRPERSVRTSPWLKRIAASTIAGVAWSRVRIVEFPLTEYTRWELIAFVESQATGEQVFVVEREQVGDLGPDFWLLDQGAPDARAVVMHYAPDGRLEERELIDGDEIERRQLWRSRKLALKHAVPLNTFLSRLGADV